MKNQSINIIVRTPGILWTIGLCCLFCTICLAGADMRSAGEKEAISKKDISREFKVDKQYLNFPVKNGAPKRYVHLLVGGEIVREFEIELPAAFEKPDFWVFLDATEFRDKTATLRLADADNDDANILSAITLDDKIKGSETMYREKLRPQFHFTSRRGWINDTNGLVFYQGQYHLFYQHNPYGWKWGNMTWGHAVSKDLVCWTELPDALHPDSLGTIYSGSAVVDWNNTSGFQTGSEKILVCMYTSAGATNPWSKGKPFTQSIAYSNDSGRSWTKYQHNPVLGHIAAENRDPKVIRHDKTRQWIMALYLDGSAYALFASPDLKNWKKICDIDIPGCSECPDFFPLSVDGDSNKTKWVFWAANGKYVLGDFDGNTFIRTSDVLSCYAGTSAYAGQTWSDMPAGDGRRIHCAWLRQEMPDMPFNQMLTFPVELTLRTVQDEVRIFANPVREIEKLYGKSYVLDEKSFADNAEPLTKINSELLHIRSIFSIAAAGTCGFHINGVDILYDAAAQELSCLDVRAKVIPIEHKIKLEILVDRTSIEIFANDGLVYMPIGHSMVDSNKSLKIIRTGNMKIMNVEVHKLKSAWGKDS